MLVSVWQAEIPGIFTDSGTDWLAGGYLDLEDLDVVLVI